MATMLPTPLLCRLLRRLLCRLVSRRALVATLLACGPATGVAGDQIDLHLYWDARCGSCHGHAGAFARRTLRVEQGRLLGHHQGERLDLFLRQHYLNDALVAPISQMLRAQVQAPPLFEQHCSRCHDSAAQFARTALGLQQGQLVDRRQGLALADSLRRHGGLAPEQVAPLLARLRQVLTEVGAAPAP